MADAGIERIKPHQLDGYDDRPMTELKKELHTILTINALSHRCAENRDHESEWNNRVHTKVLELALGNDEACVGFRSVAAARITSTFRPTHSPGLTAGKIVDYVIFLEPSCLAREAITSLVSNFSVFMNHVSYEALRTRPIAISIETKTESRTVEEAKVQLGVWLAGQVASIEHLIQQTAVLGTTHSADLLSQVVFPLLDVQSENWSLFLGRVSSDTSTSMSSSSMRKPASPIHIFHSIPLGNTANTAQTYRLIKCLKALRAWIDIDFRMWWDKVLGIDRRDGD